MLPDATVLSLGGGAPGPLKNLNGEIYKPGYLFKEAGGLAPRPVITDAPQSIAPQGTFQIKVDDPSDIDRLTFVKNGAVTHSLNMDTRFVELPFTVGANNTLTVDHPDNANLLTPGYWMLFAIDDDGVPSVAKTIKVQIGGQTMVAAAQGFATLSGDASETASGSFQLRAARRATAAPSSSTTPSTSRATSPSPSTCGSATAAARTGSRSCCTRTDTARAPPPR